ncbi:MAG: DUF5916 domain-containing protein [Gammaproteobacteria bacterium]|nr:DUF5916 domain-containing protein [Gammaproteobacteria bacterium]
MLATHAGEPTPYVNAKPKRRHASCAAYPARNHYAQTSFLGFGWIRPCLRKVKPRASSLVSTCVIAATISLTIGVWAQEPPRPHVVASKLEKLPTLDGDVKGDPAWQSLTPITNFTQWQPTNGAPATRRTEVYFAYSDEFVHVGVICHEPSQDDIIISSDGFQSDSFAMAIDTFRNAQTGFMFGTNPIGVEYDASLDNEYADWNWSTSWKVRTKYIDEGWSAEFEIPFTSLRYGNDEVQTWGVNFARISRKINEQSHWAALPIQFSTYRLSLAGQIGGIKVPRYRQNLKITPYALSGIVKSEGASVNSTDRENDLGFDLKYSVTRSLTLDATYNTDFAQVELDQLQVNLGRFNLFFPETRPFFLENAGLFYVGFGGVQLFHSRNIGIEPGGLKLPLTGGARITGKVGSSNNLGMLFVRAESGEYLPQNDFFVGRFNREMKNRSSLGFIFVNREGGDTENQTFGIDGKWGVGEHTDFQGYVGKTNTPGIKDDDHAFALGSNYRSSVWNLNLGLAEVGSGFNPEVGFTSRIGYRAVSGGIHHTTSFPEKGGLKEWNQILFLDGFWDFDGYLESGFGHLETWWLWENGADFWPVINLVSEGVKYDFDIVGVTIPAGDYDNLEFSINTTSPSTKPLRATLRLSQGGFYNGDRFNAGLYLAYRVENKWDISASYTHNNIDLPTKDSAFTADLARLGVTYMFSAKARLSALVQHNIAEDIFATNVRFSWLRTANTGFYLVYSEFDERRGIGANRKQLVLKYTHLFDVL